MRPARGTEGIILTALQTSLLWLILIRYLCGVALIFSRENGVYEFRENVNEQVTLSNRTPENKLYLVSSNDWNLPQTENAYRWFLEKLTFLMEEESATSETVAQIVSGDDKKARILKELLLADLGITDVTIKNSSGKVPVITTTHRIINEDAMVNQANVKSSHRKFIG